MKAIPLFQEVNMAEPVQTTNTGGTISAYFYSRTNAEKLLTMLQILAAVLTISVAVRILFFKKN